MEIYEKGQIFIQKDDDYVFDHTKIILRGTDDEYFYAKTDQRILPSKIDVDGLDITKIPADRVWPVAEPKFTRAPDSLPSTCYLKRPSLMYYEDIPDGPHYGRQILSEVEACEVLRIHPHPNITQYLGCVVRDGRIRGLGFVKYPITLSQMLKDRIPFRRNHCLRGIEARACTQRSQPVKHHDR